MQRGPHSNDLRLWNVYKKEKKAGRKILGRTSELFSPACFLLAAPFEESNLRIICIIIIILEENLYAKENGRACVF